MPIPVGITQNSQQVLLPIVQYYYYSNPQIEHLTPKRGPTDGGTKVKIQGLNMFPLKDVPAINVSKYSIFKFGKYIAKFDLVSIFYANAYAPQVNTPGKILVQVMNYLYTINYFLFNISY